MATLKFFVSAKKPGKVAKIYVQLVAGAIKESRTDSGCRPRRFIVPSGQMIDPANWSNETEAPKQRTYDKNNEALKKNLRDLKEFIYDEIRRDPDRVSKDWLSVAVNRFYNKTVDGVKTLNEYLDKYIEDARGGDIKTEGGDYLSPGTVKVFEGLRRIFREYQGIYSDDRIEELRGLKKHIRDRKIMDFDDINSAFYDDFLNFLTNEGYKKNTIGRFIKNLKTVMRRAKDKHNLHKNYEALDPKVFKPIKENKPNAVYLTEKELVKLEKLDLSREPKLDRARDAFLILCETSVRISDYSKIEQGFYREDGMALIKIYQTKTEREAIIPCSGRFLRIWDKYGGKIPKMPDQYINKLIKGIAFRSGITDIIRWPARDKGMKYEATAPKWKLITCHTGRRTAITNMLKSGMSIQDVMVISGHTNPKQVQEYNKEERGEAAKRIGQGDYFKGLRAV